MASLCAYDKVATVRSEPYWKPTTGESDVAAPGTVGTIIEIDGQIATVETSDDALMNVYLSDLRAA